MKKTYQLFSLGVVLLFIIVLTVQLNMDNDEPGESKETAAPVKELPKKEMPTKETTAPEPAVMEAIEQETDIKVKTEKIIAAMTPEEKIGQIIMVGFHGTEASTEIKDLIQNKRIGGVIYFDRNMSSASQVAKLSNSLQELAEASPFDVPLMMAVDQEGGDILRMRENVSPIPSQQQLGQMASAEEVYNVAKLNGKELDSMGIHINFSPVLDLSETDTRSFGKDPKKTYEYGAKVIQGLNDSSVTGAVKHFPGHGRSNVDPHVETSSVEADQLELENSDLYPFAKMIQEKDNGQFFVMVTHVKYPAYDKDKPASLSPIIMEQLLREKLGYDGLVVTDDLEMGAVNKYYSYEDMGKEAVQAGADLLLVCHEYEHQLEVYNALIKAVKSGEIPIERINEAAGRVISYKLTNIEQAEVDPDKAASIVKNTDHIRMIQSIK
ncbi:beta-N-acetylhexosaminidase [Bacillus aerolatus]|uniref:beta-N-acetylhexosaminidase n=1 Tax=Bacillus aerolatus TaxID=2653354 RepID=A0A6I1FFD0_9BACI|nr:beta-N-acetylhexosaminidase [Bacillus aerolatus]KAB7706642.1 beta-N-acetylhexosaminidase [Bacillus aerolatus]